MSEVLAILHADPPFPRAGKEFKVIVELRRPAERKLRITFEKHRVTVDQSGTHALCPILDGYFTDDGIPKPITIKKGAMRGTTAATVRKDAKNPPCPDPKGSGIPGPVVFPDRLMVTAFVMPTTAPTDPPIGKAHVVVTIRPPK